MSQANEPNPTGAHASSANGEPRDLIGSIIGNYRLTRQLGGGSMGTVYEAVHNQINRRVAIKVLHAHLSSDPEQRSRFLNEARAVSQVEHPGLIQTYDCGELPGGQIYMIMEFVVGSQLADRLQTTEPLPQAEALRIGMRMAQALTAAHAAGIIHRDLKPENVMILGEAPQKTGGPPTLPGDRVKVLDFGIAKILQSHVDARQTAPGSVLGTPLYMSPEQCVGNLVTDPRADVYALGVMLYELLCGRPPFISERFAFLMRMHVNEAPKPLRERNPAVIAAVEALVLRMLAKRPIDRPTMAQVAVELEHILLRHFAPTLETDREVSQQVRLRALAGASSHASPAQAPPPLARGEMAATVVNSSGPVSAPSPRPPADREARSAAVVDREARSAAVVDREARSAAVVDLMKTVVNAPAPSPATRPQTSTSTLLSPPAAAPRPLLMIIAVALIAATLGALMVALLMRSALR